MPHSVIPPYAGPIPDPSSRLDSLIADARADLAAAEIAVDAASAVIEAIEPHPHAHGHTAGEDCTYAGIGADHFLPLAGLLSQPWRAALDVIVMAQKQQNFDYLLKAFPAAIADVGDTLIDDGADLLDARSDRLEQDLSELFERKPIVALGLIWRLFGFHRRDRDPWVGIFAFRSDLPALIVSTGMIAEDTMLGDALAATVTACRPLLAEVGKEELCRRAARRDAERQASWAEVPEAYRQRGSWRGWAPTKRQRHLMQRIEAARCLPMAATGRRGDTSDGITRAGGNPRFALTGVEKL
ncbi:hypothetical protein [Sphingomonas sp.]|uniref:hypothetical protein n=1 Tax=Sphingomonas sp. TaxID=28214 RepID=UPI002EDA9C4B